MSNPFRELIQAAKDLVSSSMESSDRASQVPTEAVVRLRHAAARAATALATPPTPSECALASNERARAGVAETTLGVTGAGEPPTPPPALRGPLLKFGQGDYGVRVDPVGRYLACARTKEGQDIEVGPAGHIEPRA